MQECYDDDMQSQMKEYRNQLVQAEQKSIDSFDKSLLTMSGGAIGITFVFVENVAGPGPMAAPALLIGAWVCWVVVIGLTILSFYTSYLALRKCLRQASESIRAGNSEAFKKECPGGIYGKLVTCLNPINGLLFVVGLVLVIIFAAKNIG